MLQELQNLSFRGLLGHLLFKGCFTAWPKQCGTGALVKGQRE